MIKCCIFDLDGTLLDTLGTITHYVNKTITTFGFEPISEDECRYFAGNGPEALIRRALESKNYRDEGGVLKILAKYRENYDAAPLYLTRPFDGISDMLKKLSERNIACAVISNKQHEAVVPVVKHFFGDLVAISRGAMPGVPKKPAPDAVCAIMKELGVSEHEVVYVGDTDVDMQTGRAFSAAKTVGVTWGFREVSELLENGADAIASSAEELLREVLS